MFSSQQLEILARVLADCRNRNLGIDCVISYLKIELSNYGDDLQFERLLAQYYGG